MLPPAYKPCQRGNIIGVGDVYKKYPLDIKLPVSVKYTYVYLSETNSSTRKTDFTQH